MQRILIAPELMAASATVYAGAYAGQMRAKVAPMEARAVARDAVKHFVETMREIEKGE